MDQIQIRSSLLLTVLKENLLSINNIKLIDAMGMDNIDVEVELRALESNNDIVYFICSQEMLDFGFVIFICVLRKLLFLRSVCHMYYKVIIKF